MTGLTHFQGRLLLGVGAAVMIALPGNWMMQLAAFALLSAGALAWQDAARWFFYASIAADVMIFFVLLGGTPVLGAGSAHTIAATPGGPRRSGERFAPSARRRRGVDKTRST